MPIPRSATVTQRNPPRTEQTESVTHAPTLSTGLRTAALALGVYAGITLARYALTGALGPVPFGSYALILGVALWLADGQRRVMRCTRQLRDDLDRHEAQEDLQSMLRLVAEATD